MARVKLQQGQTTVNTSDDVVMTFSNLEDAYEYVLDNCFHQSVKITDFEGNVDETDYVTRGFFIDKTDSSILTYENLYDEELEKTFENFDDEKSDANDDIDDIEDAYDDYLE